MCKLRKFAFVLFFVFALSSASWALNPHDALNERPEASIYFMMNMDDLGGMLKNLCSPSNIQPFLSMMDPDEQDSFRMVTAMLSQVPAKSVAFIAGTAADKTPFLQMAISMPQDARAKLDLVAAGKATPEDLVTLVAGEAALLFASMIRPELQQGAMGPYYAIEGQVVIGAKEDLLLVTLSPSALEASLQALENKGRRLAIKRQFDSPNYYMLHIDIPTVVSLAEGELDGEVDVKTLQEFFKAPLKMEMGFESKAESVLVSFGMNALESIKSMDRFKNLTPATGANFFLTGGGKLLLGLSGAIGFNADDLKVYPEFAAAWEQLVAVTTSIGITGKDIENLLTGSLSLVWGSDATIMGKPTPGGYIALSGQGGAAAKVLKVLLENEDLKMAIPLVPLKIKGWDTLVMVDPNMVPVPLLIGSTKDTLFLGVVNSDAMDKKPELPKEVVKLSNEKVFSLGFFDAASVWEYLRQESADASSHIGGLMMMLPENISAAAREVLGADLSITFFKLWAPTLSTAFMEFSTVDVPEEKRLSTRLAKVKALVVVDDSDYDDDDDEED